jgi:prepilin-type N-terminal cleavage/methylation domain-containing protein
MIIMKTNDCNRGFSLIEILIVLGILGILGAMSTFSWQRYVANTDLRTAGRDLASEISLYRQKAMGESTSYTMTFEVANNRYIVTPGDIVKSFASLGSGIRLDSLTFVDAVISIQSRGLLSNGRIILVNGRGSSATITVDLAGRTHVEFNMQ